MTLVEAISQCAVYGGAIYRHAKPTVALIVDAAHMRSSFVWLKVWDKPRQLWITKKWSPVVEDLIANDYEVSKLNSAPIGEDLL